MTRLAYVLLVFASAVSAEAQNPANDNLPVAVVMVEALPFPAAKAVLIRRKELRPQNIVLVTRQTSPSDLTRAMATLARSRQNKGDRVTDDMVAPIAQNNALRRSKDHPQAVRDLHELRQSRPRYIEGVGPARIIYSHVRPRPALDKK